MSITEHFAREEFACHDQANTPYPEEWVTDRLLPLCESLEVIREAAGGEPLHVDSGYRTPEYQRQLYGNSAHDGLIATPEGSQHPQGTAADIVHASLSPRALHALVGKLVVAGKLPHVGGLGLYPNFLHVDCRRKPPTGHVAQWGGSRLTNIA